MVKTRIILFVLLSFGLQTISARKKQMAQIVTVGDLVVSDREVKQSPGKGSSKLLTPMWTHQCATYSVGQVEKKPSYLTNSIFNAGMV